MPVVITSRKNETAVRAARLAASAAFRRERREFLIEGARLCADAAASGEEIRSVFYTERAAEKYGDYLSGVVAAAGQAFLVSPSVAQLLSDTKTPQGVFCVCGISGEDRDVSGMGVSGSYLALENIQDPANLGAALRTAEALGVRGVVLGGECCDVYSPKVLRASMGAVFRLPFFRAEDMAEAVARMNAAGFSTFAAVPDRAAPPVTKADFSHPCVAVIGNEGNGLRPDTVRACTGAVTIPMAGRAESLNASAAAVILMWEMMRER